jgi:hypothetical protein
MEGFVLGKVIWEGWREPDENTPQPVGIIYGANLSKKAPEKKDEPKEKQDIATDLGGRNVIKT